MAKAIFFSDKTVAHQSTSNFFEKVNHPLELKSANPTPKAHSHNTFHTDYTIFGQCEFALH